MAPSKKIMLFVCLLVAATAVVVPAVAQIGQIFGGLLGGAGGVIGNLLSNLLGVIQGTLFCSASLNATVGPGGIITSPPLSNVTVQLRCGPGNGTLISTAITGSNGNFSIDVLNNGIITLLNQVLSGGCRLVVATPIAQCNATLPSIGNLTSNLFPNGTIIVPPICVGPICVDPISVPVLRPGPFVVSAAV